MPAETATKPHSSWLVFFACQMPLFLPCTSALPHCLTTLRALFERYNSTEHKQRSLLADKWSSGSNSSSIRPGQHQLCTTHDSGICSPGAPSSAATRPHPQHCCGPHEHWQGTTATTHALILSGSTCVIPCPDSIMHALLPCVYRLQRLPHNSLGLHLELTVACRSLRMLPCMISTAVSSLQSPPLMRRQRRCVLY